MPDEAPPTESSPDPHDPKSPPFGPRMAGLSPELRRFLGTPRGREEKANAPRETEKGAPVRAGRPTEDSPRAEAPSSPVDDIEETPVDESAPRGEAGRPGGIR